MDEKLILLVEDNPDDEELTCLALSQCSVTNTTIVVRDGAEAMDFLLGKGKYAGQEDLRLPQLILLDLKLPKLSGLEVLEKIRANPRMRLIPVVILTSSSEMNDIITSYLLGANSYIRKPVEFRAFAEMINTLGSYWLVFNQPPPMPN